MPIYSYRCDKCGEILETVQLGQPFCPECCAAPMVRQPSMPAMIKIKGEGFPSRRKWMDNWTPESPAFPTGSQHGERY